MNFIRSAFRASRPSLSRVQSLFLPDDKAAFFDYSTTANLYQNSDATTAAAVGSPVRAMLDVSRGLELGPELLPVLDFTTWSNAGSVTGKSVDTVTVSGGGGVYKPIGVKNAGQQVVISYTSTVSFVIRNGSDFNGAIEFQAGSKTVTAYGTMLNGLSGSLYISLNGTGTITIHSLSVRELKGNHAIWPTTASKPTLRTTPQTGRYWLEAIDANRALNITFASAPGTMYVGRVMADGIEWLTETWGTTVNVLRQNQYNAGIIARSRPWSDAEKALIAAYFARQMPTLGPELLVNGDFSTDGFFGWINASSGSGSAQINSGVATLTGVDTSNRGRINSSSVINFASARPIAFSFDVLSGSVPIQAVVSAPAPVIDRFGALSNTKHRFVAIANAGAVSLGVNVYGAGARAVDNVSLREIL